MKMSPCFQKFIMFTYQTLLIAYGIGKTQEQLNFEQAPSGGEILNSYFYLPILAYCRSPRNLGKELNCQQQSPIFST